MVGYSWSRTCNILSRRWGVPPLHAHWQCTVMWWCMFVFEFCFLGHMAWQVYARDSRECFAKVRHQYILSAASAFTFWNNWAFRMQSGAWPTKMHLNTTPFMKVSHLLPWKRMCSNTSSLKVPHEILGQQHLPSMTQAFRLACTAGPTGECLCPFSSCHSIYMASDPQLWAAIFSPHICRHRGSLVAAWENRLLITCFKSSTLSGKHLTTISALRFKWTPKQRDTLKQLFLPKFSHFFQKQQFSVGVIPTTPSDMWCLPQSTHLLRAEM